MQYLVLLYGNSTSRKFLEVNKAIIDVLAVEAERAKCPTLIFHRTSYVYRQIFILSVVSKHNFIELVIWEVQSIVHRSFLIKMKKILSIWSKFSQRRHQLLNMTSFFLIKYLIKPVRIHFSSISINALLYLINRHEKCKRIDFSWLSVIPSNQIQKDTFTSF